jgi:hypothetical protein
MTCVLRKLQSSDSPQAGGDKCQAHATSHADVTTSEDGKSATDIGTSESQINSERDFTSVQRVQHGTTGCILASKDREISISPDESQTPNKIDGSGQLFHSNSCDQLIENQRFDHAALEQSHIVISPFAGLKTLHLCVTRDLTNPSSRFAQAIQLGRLQDRRS